MNYDEIIEDAIRQTVTDAGQADELSRLILHLFRDISAGNESLDDQDGMRRRSEILYDAARTSRSKIE